MSVSTINRTLKMVDGNNEAVMEEFKREMEMKYQYGTDAPTSSTVGNVYYRLGATSATALKIYIKVGSTWYGG